MFGAPKDFGGGMIIPSLPHILNEIFCSDINQKLLVPHGFRCEAIFWLITGPGHGRADEIEHMALAIFKIDSSMPEEKRRRDEDEGGTRRINGRPVRIHTELT